MAEVSAVGLRSDDRFSYAKYFLDSLDVRIESGVDQQKQQGQERGNDQILRHYSLSGLPDE